MLCRAGFYTRLILPRIKRAGMETCPTCFFKLANPLNAGPHAMSRRLNGKLFPKSTPLILTPDRHPHGAIFIPRNID